MSPLQTISKDSKINYCLVCGMGSHRPLEAKPEDGGFLRKTVGPDGKTYVACDSHSDEDLQAAVSTKVSAKVASAKPISVPSAPQKQPVPTTGSEKPPASAPASPPGSQKPEPPKDSF